MNKRLLAAGLLVLNVCAHAQLKVEVSEDRITRGKYLVHQIAGCDGCHSERESTQYSFPPKQDLLLAGGNIFLNIGPRAITPNLTPYALGGWSDQEIFDAMTRGIRPDGRVLDPIMPYDVYGRMEPERIYDMIAYLRSLEPIAAGPYPAEFPGEHTAFQPRPGELSWPDEDAPEVELGAYLAEVAHCNACHVGVGAESITDHPYAGGREFRAPGLGVMRAANLTPDPDTGIGSWSRDVFLARFEGMRGSWETRVEAGGANTVMHWWQYSLWRESDLSALYAYLRTLDPVANTVNRFEPLPGEFVSTRNWSERQAASVSSQ